MKRALSFFYVFNSVGACWSFATLNPYPSNEHIPFVARIANNNEQLNGLFDNTINEICHNIQAFATSNKSYTYSQMLREEDRVKFFKAMEVEIGNHESRHHWDLRLCKDLPPGAKTIMAI